MPKPVPMVGRRFGRRVVLRRVRRVTPSGNAFYRVRCDCGTLSTVRGTFLRRGEAKSCGCGAPKAADLLKYARRVRKNRSRLWKHVVARFWRQVRQTRKFSKTCDRSFGPCWEWTGGTRAGYGRFKIRGIGMVSASQFSYYAAYGVLPDRDACHVCDNPRCVRPNHLFDGDEALNMYDHAMKRLGAKLIEVATPQISMKGGHVVPCK